MTGWKLLKWLPNTHGYPFTGKLRDDTTVRCRVVRGADGVARMTDEKDPSPWKVFVNSTHNGRYWALQRFNRKWWGGIEVMQTKGCQPRRFGSEESAQRAADTANAGALPK